jgi:ABC-type transporter Mla MlaB component
MAKKHENSLIGFDPLAWMENPQQPVVLEPVQNKQTIEYPPNLSTKPDNEKSVLNMENRIDKESTVEDSFEIASAESASGFIELQAVLNIQNINPLHQSLLKALELNAKIEIDASAVSIIDTASLQLLVILKTTAIKQQKEVIIDFPSDKFLEASNLLGLSEILGVDQAVSGFF